MMCRFIEDTIQKLVMPENTIWETFQEFLMHESLKRQTGSMSGEGALRSKHFRSDKLFQFKIQPVCIIHLPHTQSVYLWITLVAS